MSRRAYDYATPIFGGDFCCAPPPVERPSQRADAKYRSLVKQNSILQSSLNRADSGSGRPQLSKMDSLSSRSPLSRGNSSSTRTETSYSTTSSGAGGVPTTFSSTTYKSPYGNTYRSFH